MPRTRKTVALPTVRGRGRPTLYDPPYHIENAYRLTLCGLTIEELADVFGVSAATVYEWMNEHEEFSEAVTRGRTIADGKVAEGLFKRATGYEYDSEKIVTLSRGANEGSYVERVDTKTHVPPDPGAALNWLKNRQSSKWKEKVEQTTTLQNPDGSPVAQGPTVTIRYLKNGDAPSSA